MNRIRPSDTNPWRGHYEDGDPFSWEQRRWATAQGRDIETMDVFEKKLVKQVTIAGNTLSEHFTAKCPIRGKGDGTLLIIAPDGSQLDIQDPQMKKGKRRGR